jgi:hypothetical protein
LWRVVVLYALWLEFSRHVSFVYTRARYKKLLKRLQPAGEGEDDEAGDLCALYEHLRPADLDAEE